MEVEVLGQRRRRHPVTQVVVHAKIDRVKVIVPAHWNATRRLRALEHGRVGRPVTRPKAVAADKAYSSKGNRSYLRKRGIKSVIPVKADQAANRKKRGSRGGREYAFDPVVYKDRNTVERCINKLKSWRGIATRFDKTPESYSAGLHLRGSVIWLRSLRPAE